jgi:hypothetical protein
VDVVLVEDEVVLVMEDVDLTDDEDGSDLPEDVVV